MTRAPQSPAIAVIGSSNIDLIMKMERLPEKGETVTNAAFRQTFGGKGANQAVAAARCGATVRFVSAVGDDAYTEKMLDNFRKDDIDLSAILRCEAIPSGHALVMIGENGMNYLSVAPEANARLSPDVLAQRADALRSIPCWILQCEIPPPSLRFLLTQLKTPRNRVIWNFAPAIAMDDPPLAAADILVVNDVEAGQLSGIEVIDKASGQQAMAALRQAGVREVVLTLGASGALYAGPDQQLEIPAYKVDVVDTTAAGDTFCGAMAAALSEGRPWPDTLAFANAAAALSVSVLGAQSSIPRRRDVDALLASKAHNR
jgi:ribokinase